MSANTSLANGTHYLDEVREMYLCSKDDVS